MHAQRAAIAALTPDTPLTTLASTIHSSGLTGVVSPGVGGTKRRTKRDILNDIRANFYLEPLEAPIAPVAVPMGEPVVQPPPSAAPTPVATFLR